MNRPDAASLPFEPPDALALDSLRRFRWRGVSQTVVSNVEVSTNLGVRLTVDTLTNEFWTARQRAAHSLHEISYRACFKPQLPLFFIERLTEPGDVVYDPFMGRGEDDRPDFCPFYSRLRILHRPDVRGVPVVPLWPSQAAPTSKLRSITGTVVSIVGHPGRVWPDA